MTKTYRFGLMSCGKVSHDFALAIRHSKRATLQAVAARSSESAEKFGKLHGAKTCYGSYEKLAKDPDIDVVYVGSIHTTHKKLTEMALENGKHVICEKPMTVSLKETIEMYDCAKKNKRLLIEGMWNRFFPAMKKARQLIESGAIGEVMRFCADFGIFIPKDCDRIWKAELAGGGLFDLGVYPIAIAPMIFTEQELENMTITASGSLTTKEEGGPIDRFGSVSLITKTNKHAILSWNTTVCTPQTLEIAGTKGNISIPHCHAPTEIRYERKTPASETTTIKFDLPKYPDEFPPLFFPNSEGFVYELEAFCDHLDKAEGSLDIPEYTSKESIAVARIIQECRNQMKLIYPWEKDTVEHAEKKQRMS